LEIKLLKKEETCYFDFLESKV